MECMVERKKLKKEYNWLEYRENEKIPYVKNSELRVDGIYLTAHIGFGLKLKDIANEKGLSLEAVIEAARWCQENEGLLKGVLEEEAKEGGVED